MSNGSKSRGEEGALMATSRYLYILKPPKLTKRALSDSTGTSESESLST